MEPGQGPVADRLRLLQDQLAGHRAQAERMRSGIEAINEVLAELGQMRFDTEVPLSADPHLSAAFAGLSMLSEELDHAHQSLLLERDRAIGANRAKSVFLASMSHELRTPLNAILGYAELLADEVTDQDGLQNIAQDLDRIVRASRQLLGLIDAVLDMARIEAGTLEYHLQAVDPIELLQEVEIAVAPTVHHYGNRLQILVNTRQPVQADPLRLRQILVNLVANAAKFTQNGEIHLESTQRGTQTLFTVRDNGMGMDEATLESAFTPFVQASSVSRDERSGIGLGLAISREHALGMRGQLEATSELGVGSEFRLSLPTAP